MHAFDDRHISTTLLKSLRYLRARYETAHHCIAITGNRLGAEDATGAGCRHIYTVSTQLQMQLDISTQL